MKLIIHTYHTMKLNPQPNPFEADPRWLAEALILLVVFLLAKNGGFCSVFKGPPSSFCLLFLYVDGSWWWWWWWWWWWKSWSNSWICSFGILSTLSSHRCSGRRKDRVRWAEGWHLQHQTSAPNFKFIWGYSRDDPRSFLSRRNLIKFVYFTSPSNVEWFMLLSFPLQKVQAQKL